MKPAARSWLWNHLLDADLNRRYWRYVTTRYKVRDQWGRILLALTSSGAVAGWAIWDQYPSGWQILSGLSAVVAIALPILNFPARVETAADLHGRWTELSAEYERLWVAAEDGVSRLTDVEMQVLAQKENSFAPKEATVPYNKRLAATCQAEVKNRWRLR